MTSPSREAIALDVISGGAAQGIVGAVTEEFRVATGAAVRGTFGAVGAMREKLLAGAPCDALILTAPLIATLEAQGHVLPGTAVPLGRVSTGIAVRAGESVPAIADGAALRTSLLAASGIYFPDPELATAGIHFAKVLRELGIHETVAKRLRPFPNGAAAMGALALVGPLPAGFELSTTYTVAVCARAREPDLARRFVSLLSGSAARTLRLSAGFD